MQKPFVLFNKTLVIGILVLFIGMSIIPSIGGTVVEKKSNHPISDGNILYVGGTGPGNYTSIQEAIDNASDGDTVFVFNGMYDSDDMIIINKSIGLIGDNKVNTIINGTGISIEVSDVYISGFTIQNGLGIIIITSNSDPLINNTIQDNIFKAKEDIIWIGGITIANSSYNTLSDNSFLNCSLMIAAPSNHNSVINNTINGKPLVYFEDASEKVINNAGQVILIDCNNITVENLDLNNLFFGIQLIDSVNCLISDNTFSNNAMVGFFINSSNNIISGNTFSNNFYGLTHLFCGKNKITKNSFQNNGFSFIFINSSNNIISYNNFKYKCRRINHNIISTESNNKWFRNYWNRPRLLPVVIWNIKHSNLKYFPILPTSPDIDWLPAKKPNNINSTKSVWREPMSEIDKNKILHNYWFHLFLD